MALPYTLTGPQKRQLREDGFVHLRGVVPPHTLDRVLRMINARMGQGISQEEIAGSPAGGFFKELTRADPFQQMIPSPVARSLVESAIGDGRVGEWGGAQLALRFPKAADAKRPPGCHIDGLHTSDNGVPEGELYSFTALIGTFLSRCDRPDMGNFTVWPGGHRVVADWFARHDYREIEACMPPVRDAIGEGVPVLAEPGDVVIANYLLPHGISHNASGHIRYAIFNRIKHVDHESRKFDALKDPWLLWEGLAPT